MRTSYVISPDQTRIAYDVNGAGPAIMLLHGGGSFRQEWHAAGYVERLEKAFQVITVDLRGHGESDQPEDPAWYTQAKMGQDFLAVADACGVVHFTIWGFSYGGKAGRYLAVQSARVEKMILMSTPFGPAITGKSRQDVFDFCAHWSPILQAQRDGTLDFASLSPEDQQLMDQCHVPSMLGWVPAMLDWPPVEAADFRCPVLWLVGSEDQPTIASLEAYKDRLKGSRVQVQILEGLNHEGVFEEIDTVFDRMVSHLETDDGAAERYVRGLRDRKMVGAPGERFAYSNIAYNVLGDLIAKVSGQTNEDIAIKIGGIPTP